MAGCKSPQHAEKIRNSMKRYWEQNPPTDIWVKNNSNGHKGIEKSERTIINLVASHNNAWYGNVRYAEDIRYKNKYCELWNEDLKERIRAYWGYVSALSGKPETSVVKGVLRVISCHHVYYQKKACCVWDEDEQGYYADINIGTRKIPNIYRHYIDGDPNKFVTLTAGEHKSTDFNKLYWIKTFEKIIEDQGGKCYFTREDIEKLLE